jgi:hypothetical protein
MGKPHIRCRPKPFRLFPAKEVAMIPHWTHALYPSFRRLALAAAAGAVTLGAALAQAYAADQSGTDGAVKAFVGQGWA